MYVFNARFIGYSPPQQLDTTCMLHTLFSVLSLWVHPHTVKVSLLPSTLDAFHMTKNTRLSTPAQLQCSRSGAWEPGNEAKLLTEWMAAVYPHSQASSGPGF